MISASAEDVCTIISILPIKLNEDKPLVPSNYQIPACKDYEKDCEVLIVRRGSYRVYIDESRPALIIPEPADVIAGAICRDFKVCSFNYVSGEAEPGLFWARGGYDKQEALLDKTLQGQFNSARALQMNWFKSLVSTADDDWARYRMRKMVSDVQRLACKALGLDREWDIDLEVGKAVKMEKCKFCRGDVHPDAVICMHCRGILNMDRYKTEYVRAD